MTRAFLIECSGDIWTSIGQSLIKRHGWNVLLWTGADEQRAEATALCPNVRFIANTDAALNLHVAKWPKAIVDAPLIEKIASEADTIIRMMDRLDLGRSFSYDARQGHFFALVRTWAGALDHFRPDVVVFSSAPHIVFDYVLYVLCQQRGIPTPMFERHGLPGWVFLQNGIDGPPLEGSSKIALSATYAAWFDRSTAGGKTSIPPNFQRKISIFGLEKKRISLLRSLWFEAKRGAYLLKRYGFGPLFNSYLRSPRTGGRASWFETEKARVSAIIKKRKLASLLAQLSSQPIENEPYVLLALHYQPERATFPMSGIYGDQLLVVDLLARTLPNDWKLYVKEHPWQLQPFSRGEMCRDELFYRQIASYSNVRLLPAEADSTALIPKAAAIATGTGSMAWQGLCLGVPALVFGAAWYRRCPGAYEIESAEDLRAAMTAISAGTAGPARSQVRDFLAMIEQACIPGVLEPSVEAVNGLDLGQAAAGMADALVAASLHPGLTASAEAS